MKLLSVTVPCYNSAEYMKKCIDSLLIGGDKVEIIIINDGSKDDTGSIADAYAEKYPNIVKVVHQENGGHGEGINQGVKRATGKYFKVVDSDDTVDKDALLKILAFLEALEPNGSVDFVVTNYVYTYEDGRKDKPMRYRHYMDEGKILSWKDIKPLSVQKYFTLHSSIFRTELLKKIGYELPKHTWYEDNLFIYVPLQYVKTIAYIDCDFYRYSIGRPGQSVSEEALTKRADHQRRVTSLVFSAADVLEIKKGNKYQGKNLEHELMLMLQLAFLFTNLGEKNAAKKYTVEMKDELKSSNPEMAKKYLARPTIVLMSNSKIGYGFCRTIYKTAHKFVPFN